MEFRKDSNILVKDKQGNYVNGVLLREETYGYMPSFWVQYQINGNVEVGLFNEEDLIEWNSAKKSLCECGSAKLGHPGHSHFCPLFK